MIVPGAIRAVAVFYPRAVKFSIGRRFQYRFGICLVLAGMVVEALVYMALWQAVARANGGSVGGWSTDGIAGYFIVWTLVRNMTVAYPPHSFAERIRSGQFSALLLRPMHPIHYDIADFAAWKLVAAVYWIPVVAVLALSTNPDISVTPPEAVVFVLALWGAYLIRAIYLWLLGLISFWTTRATAVFDGVLVVELLLSGRLLPMSLLPEWVRQLAGFLPFSWAFGFPVEAVAGAMSFGQLMHGLAMQAFWIVAGSAGVAAVWRLAVRRYTGVGI